MTITARYPGTCPTCHQHITPGQQIEWTKGEKPKHTRCAGASQSSGHAHRHQATCRVCGYVERRNARGYVDGDRILRSGECQSCYEERKMGY